MSKTLILIPTLAEMEFIRQRITFSVGVQFALCGFGPIAAAARASTLIAGQRPSQVILVGIAGAVGDRLPIGTSSEFNVIACVGVGAGSGDQHCSAEELGWNQWLGESDACASIDSIGDAIQINTPKQAPRWLATVCSASGNDADVRRYLKRFPDAIAEDMEGFGVAMACRLASVPLRIIRGISNVAGDRDKSRWRIPDALDAAGLMTQQALEQSKQVADAT